MFFIFFFFILWFKVLVILWNLWGFFDGCNMRWYRIFLMLFICFIFLLCVCFLFLWVCIGIFEFFVIWFEWLGLEEGCFWVFFLWCKLRYDFLEFVVFFCDLGFCGFESRFGCCDLGFNILVFLLFNGDFGEFVGMEWFIGDWLKFVLVVEFMVLWGDFGDIWGELFICLIFNIRWLELLFFFCFVFCWMLYKIFMVWFSLKFFILERFLFIIK